MNKFLGIWYVIQKTSTASSCITYNFTKTAEPMKYELEQVSQHFILGLTPLHHEYKYKGELTVPDSSTPARMRVQFPLSVAGSASYTIVATDYTTYAAVFTCQKLVGFAHRQSATILSRTKDLDKLYTDKLRSRLSQHGIDPFSLSIISQSDCPVPDGQGVNINIDPNTFSSENIGNAVRKTGGAIATGVEYAVDAGKTVYHKITDHSKEDLTENPEKSGRDLNMDAEWLP